MDWTQMATFLCQVMFVDNCQHFVADEKDVHLNELLDFQAMVNAPHTWYRKAKEEFRYNSTDSQKV